jgi:ABC-type molybdate transport system substrate-binding protein
MAKARREIKTSKSISSNTNANPPSLKTTIMKPITAKSRIKFIAKKLVLGFSTA